MDQDRSQSAERTILDAPLPLLEKIRRARVELLDLSTRNRLLNTPRSGKARTIEVVNEHAVAMYQTLVADQKRFTFTPGRADPATTEGDAEHPAEGAARDPDVETLELPQPDLELDEHGRIAAHWDLRLTTRLTSASLQKRLLDLYIDAKTLQEEQGVNILYLAIGYLKWRDIKTPQIDRYAPLVLIPAILERSNAGERFHLRWSGDEIQPNLSLQEFLFRNFELKLPEITEFESLDIDLYMSAIDSIIDGKENWAVLRNDAVLGLFSFAKFMMYRDLDPEQWKSIGGFEALSTIRGVVSDGFPRSDLISDDTDVDKVIAPKDMLHVMDSDSSQSLAIHDVRRGSHLLIQGPPGTGKSQTISNVIAAAVADGKKVLFVAEKMAALEVVKRRLDRIGVGAACLELHSNKANKRTVLEELRRTWQLGPPVAEEDHRIIEQLTELRDELNEHATALHTRHTPSQLTPYQAIGHLVRLKRLGQSTQKLPLIDPTAWAPDQKDERFKLVQDLAQRIIRMGVPHEHAWFGIGNDGLLPNDRDRLIDSIKSLATNLSSWYQFSISISRLLDLEPPCHLLDMRDARQRASTLAEAPKMGASAFKAPYWASDTEPSAITAAVELAQQLRQEASQFSPANALSMDWSSHESTLAELPSGFRQDHELNQIGRIEELLERVKSDLARLAALFKESTPLTLDSARTLLAMAQHASTIPGLQREALVSHVWDRGIEAIAELADSVETAQRTRAALATTFRESAWTTSLEEARSHIAMFGRSWLRFLNSGWRRSNRLLRSLCVAPDRISHEGLLQALDDLISAQHALKRTKDAETQGLQAFGANWLGERSDVTFLRSAIAWMKELQPLGAIARERLADLADRELAADIAKRAHPIVVEIRQALNPIHDVFIREQKSPWGEELLAGRVPLTLLFQKTSLWKSTCEQCRTFHPPYDQSVQTLRARVAVIRSAQTALSNLRDLESHGHATFGTLWHGMESTPQELRAAIAWMEANPSLHDLASRTTHADALVANSEKSVALADRLIAGMRDLLSRLNFQGNRLVPKDPTHATIDGLTAQLSTWQANPEGLPEWVAYLGRAREARAKGLPSLIDALESGAVAPESAAHTFDLCYYESMLGEFVSSLPRLARFDGEKHSQRVETFIELDRRRSKRAIREVLQTHHKNLPPTGVAGPTGTLRGEFVKQRRHMPIRQLMQRCAPAIQAIKPVFMMSPLSVAQFLPPGALDFDLLVVDEASQIQPVDALGAIARAKQLVIVGDERQLPPTRFFSRLVGEHQEDDEDGAQPADIESILGLCRARGLPERMLRWHYRSRHQSLIAVSNSQFYENKLFIVPSPYNSEAGMGLRLRHMPENVYDRGGTSVNVQEAKAVAVAVVEHARSSPELSLGVATFSTKQRRAVMDELELLRREHPETEAFFAGRPDEPFFVKSLENIQGDERDVIFISVGYGRDARGIVTMNFGPLSSEGGERRLNVLISRAKRRCEIFSSISDEDIDLERGKGKGIVAFKLFLHYARTGRLAITEPEHQQTQMIFEQQVAEALKEHGYNVHSRVGTAGCFVDLAVAAAEFPGRYILGIECDGRSYRSAQSARDRDRLRRAVLEDQGWILHRVWSSDWFHRPQAEMGRLVASIEAAKAQIGSGMRRTATPGSAVSVEATAIKREDVVKVSLDPMEPESSADKYEEADFKTPHPNHELHELPSGLMASVIQKVVQIEGPVHRAEVVARVRAIWGLQRAGGRIQAAVDAGIKHATSKKDVEIIDGDFLLVPGQPIRIRDRSEVASLSLRRPEYLPPREIDTALRSTVAENLGATMEELIQCVSRKFGFRSTSSQLRELIESRARWLIENGALEWRGEHISIA
jgi:hypothetical protein